MDLNVILSEKGKQLLVVNNFKYSFQKCLKSGERRWICLNKKCKSFILSLGEMENVTVTKHITEHCHEANLEKLNRQIVSSSCKRKATEDLSEKPAKIIHICNKYCTRLEIFEVVIDFEKGIHTAVEKVWPQAQIIVCRFHLAQSWYRKIQKYG
nr:unnamed protein product [Callosobruchus analis]